MALATRCPYCQTTFRVVHDQLKLRSGMVRCGQCQHIFNGIEHLVRASNTADTAGASPAAKVPSSLPAAPTAPVRPSVAPAPATISPPAQPPGVITPGAPSGAAAAAPGPVKLTREPSVVADASRAATASTTTAAVIATPVPAAEVKARPDTAAATAAAATAAATTAAAATAAATPAPVTRPANAQTPAPAAVVPPSATTTAVAPPAVAPPAVALPASAPPASAPPAAAPATAAPAAAATTTRPVPAADDADTAAPDEYEMLPWQDTEVDPAFASSAEPATAPAESAPAGDKPATQVHAAAEGWPALHLPETRAPAPALAPAEQAHSAHGRIEPTLDDDTWPESRNTLDVARAVESLEHAEHDAAAMPDMATEADEAAAGADAASDADEPNFVKSGRRQQKWQRVWFWLQSFSLLILLLLLAAQAIYTWRDVIATRWPITKPHLQQACALLHCQVELPTQIQLLSIELGELQALPRNKNTFSYATLLRNHSNLPQSWPGIELVLLDANDHIVARRIFSPQDYQITPQERSKGFAAQSEHAVKLYFETAPQLKALGYRAEIFYP